MPYTLHVFSSEEEAIEHCPGLDVAEGDWAFFDAEGSPLKPEYSVRAYVKDGHYRHGVYSLKSGEGPNLDSLLHTLAPEIKGCGDISTIDSVRKLIRSAA